MPTNMRVPKGYRGTVSHGGKEYKPDANGIVSVHDTAVDDLKAHGLHVATDQEPNDAPDAPDVKKMNKADLLAYCEDNSIKVSDSAKVEDLRALVQADIDSKAD